jgi:hypothetical protein
VEYLVRDGALAADAIEQTLTKLRERWSDSARLLGFLAEALRTKQRESATLRERLVRVSSVVESARRLRTGGTLEGVLGLIHEEDRRLADGEDPLEVVAWVLGDDLKRRINWGVKLGLEGDTDAPFLIGWPAVGRVVDVLRLAGADRLVEIVDQLGRLTGRTVVGE